MNESGSSHAVTRVLMGGKTLDEIVEGVIRKHLFEPMSSAPRSIESDVLSELVGYGTFSVKVSTDPKRKHGIRVDIAFGPRV